MPVVIREITSEVAVRPGGQAPGPVAPDPEQNDQAMERVVHLAVKQVLARLRLEWER